MRHLNQRMCAGAFSTPCACCTQRHACHARFTAAAHQPSFSQQLHCNARGHPNRQAAQASTATAGSSSPDGPNAAVTLRRHFRNALIAFGLGAVAPVVASMAVKTMVPAAVGLFGLTVFITGGSKVPITLGAAIFALHKTGKAASNPTTIGISGAAFLAGYIVWVVSSKMKKKAADK